MSMARSIMIGGLALAAAVSADGRCAAQGPPDGSEVKAAMAKLEKLVGRWEGDAVVQVGPGEPIRVRQSEGVERKLDGAALLIEGTGREESATGEGRVVFQALAVLSYDPAAKGYKVHAFRDNGLSKVADAELTDTGLIWGFEDGRGGRVRYTITLDGDTWHEVGEYLREGQPPRKFVELTIRRVVDRAAGG